MSGAGEDWRETLGQGIAELGLAADSAAEEKLAVYIRELIKWNGVFGLVGKSRPDTDAGREIVIRHILDSLAGLPPIARLLREKGGGLADAGSGAGLPGIPLAVFLPETAVTLIEPSVKRCAFLRSVLALSGLSRVKVFEGGIEAAREKFGLVTCRAFRPLDKKTLKQLAAITGENGFIAAYKATARKTETEIAVCRALGFTARAETLRVPFLDEERRLLVIAREPVLKKP